MKIIAITVAVLAVVAFSGCLTAPTKKNDAPDIVKTQGISEVSPAEARPGIEAAYSQFIDVRTPEEYAAGHAERTRNIPLDTLAENLDKLEKNEPVYIICETGRRSMKAAEILNDAGFPQVISIAGGTRAWKDAGLPMAK